MASVLIVYTKMFENKKAKPNIKPHEGPKSRNSRNSEMSNVNAFTPFHVLLRTSSTITNQNKNLGLKSQSKHQQ